ncbi:MAG: hypothetical protein ACR2H6_10430 [Pyrinomonadaceae bacterium]
MASCMHRSVPLLLIVLALTFAACSYSTKFVVVNESDHPIEVRYKVKRFPNEPATFTARPAKIAASQVGTRDKAQWRNLTADEYQINQEERTLTVKLMSHEALLVRSMFHYIGDEDPNDVAEWPIDELSIVGPDGGMTFTGQKARKSFTYVSRVLYALTYQRHRAIEQSLAADSRDSMLSQVALFLQPIC